MIYTGHSNTGIHTKKGIKGWLVMSWYVLSMAKPHHFLSLLWCDCSEVLYICPTPSEESCFERPKKDPETGEVELYTSIDGILQAKLKDGWINWSQGDWEVDISCEMTDGTSVWWMFWHVFTSEAHVYVFPIVTGKGCQCNSLQPSLHLCFDSSNLKVSKTLRVWINWLSLFFFHITCSYFQIFSWFVFHQRIRYGHVHICFMCIIYIYIHMDMGIYSYIYIHYIDMDICWFM